MDYELGTPSQEGRKLSRQREPLSPAGFLLMFLQGLGPDPFFSNGYKELRAHVGCCWRFPSLSHQKTMSTQRSLPRLSVLLLLFRLWFVLCRKIIGNLIRKPMDASHRLSFLPSKLLPINGETSKDDHCVGQVGWHLFIFLPGRCIDCRDQIDCTERIPEKIQTNLSRVFPRQHKHTHTFQLWSIGERVQ